MFRQWANHNGFSSTRAVACHAACGHRLGRLPTSYLLSPMHLRSTKWKFDRLLLFMYCWYNLYFINIILYLLFYLITITRKERDYSHLFYSGLFCFLMKLECRNLGVLKKFEMMLSCKYSHAWCKPACFQVGYASGIQLNCGAELKPRQTQMPPNMLWWWCRPGTYYLMAMIG